MQTDVPGYRELTDKEIETISASFRVMAAVNEIKKMENLLGEVWKSHEKLAKAGHMSEVRVDPRALAEARTCLQTGFMWWVRAIAQPKSEL